jgi:ribosome-associated protein
MNLGPEISSKTTRRKPTIEPLNSAITIATLALDKKATDLAVIDVRNLASYADFVVVCSGASDRQVSALAQTISKTMSQAGVKCRGIEGKDSGRWVLMDFGDVVVHIFYDPIRAAYDIEGLWPEAPHVAIPGYDRKRDLGYAQFA